MWPALTLTSTSAGDATPPGCSPASRPRRRRTSILERGRSRRPRGVGMSNRVRCQRRSTVLAALAIVATAFGAGAAPAGAARAPTVIPIGNATHGLTYGQWSAEWWRQVLALPADRNPLLDTADNPCELGA